MHAPIPPNDTRDPGSVDITQHQALVYWLETLGVDEFRLRSAVAEVGTSAQDVRCYLGMP